MSKLRCGTCGELEYPKWTSVKDRLPDYSQPYIVKVNGIYWPCIKYFKLNVIDYATGNNGFFCTNANSGKKTKLPITHWMPLPEPPK